MLDHLGVITNPHKVDIIVEKPQQQSAFRRIANHLHLLLVAVVKERCRVQGDAFFHQLRRLRAVKSTLFHGEDATFRQAHPVLSECTRLVGTNHCGSTHGLASMHLPDQVVGLQHPLHAQGKTQCDAHRKTLRHGHYYQGDSDHQGVEEITGKVHPLEVLSLHVDSIHHQAQHHDETSYHVTGDRDAPAEPVELLIQRSLHLIIDLSATIHLAPFGLVTHFFHYKHAMTFHHHAATTHIVGGISGVRLELRWLHCLATRRLARQIGFVHAHGQGFHQSAVGRHLIASTQNNGVANDHVFSLDALYHAVTIDGHRHLILALVQDVKLLVGTLFKEKAHTRSQHHRHEDAQRLEKHRKALAARKQLIKRHRHRQQQSYQQDAYDRILELLKKLSPYRRLFRRGKHVVTMLLPTSDHLFLRQASLIISHHAEVLYWIIFLCYLCIEKRCKNTSSQTIIGRLQGCNPNFLKLTL